MAWFPGKLHRDWIAGDAEAWRAARRASNLRWQRAARACRRRLDYYPCPEAMEIIEAHRGPGVGFNEIIDALILKAARLPD